MHPFAFRRAADASAASLLARESGSQVIAGGTDLLQLLKDDVQQPQRLVDITGLPWRGIESGPEGLRLGALAHMSEVADAPAVRDGFPAISEALLASASPQVRNMATMGGNLLQRTRCVYFRDVTTPCNRRAPGSGCSAIDGENRMHAVLGGSERCVATHASDLAVALVALDAVVVLSGPAGERRVPVEVFHRLPGETPERETVLEPGELIAAIEVPAAAHAARSRYLKVRDRASFEFAVASAAAALEIEGGVIRQARLALGGVATKPWRAREAEATLVGHRPVPASFVAAADQALAGAKPLRQNAFKIELAKRTVVRALSAAAVGA
ncbi:MAG TPA: xanthine dehydrogenase family protein subunit M [Stellaceae bacterium]|nr:xanthine dehydrogenase family protein subunit M [Stellaceae bacterium]